LRIKQKYTQPVAHIIQIRQISATSCAYKRVNGNAISSNKPTRTKRKQKRTECIDPTSIEFRTPILVTKKTADRNAETECIDPTSIELRTSVLVTKKTATVMQKRSVSTRHQSNCGHQF